MVGYTAKEMRELRLPLHRYHVCTNCRRYIDNRNHRRHVKACNRRSLLARRARSARSDTATYVREDEAARIVAQHLAQGMADNPRMLRIASEALSADLVAYDVERCFQYLADEVESFIKRLG